MPATRADGQTVLARFDSAGQYREQVRLGGVPSRAEIRRMALLDGMSVPMFRTAARLWDVFTRDQLVALVSPRCGTGLSWDELELVTRLKTWHAVHELAQEAIQQRWEEGRLIEAVRQLSSPGYAKPSVTRRR